MAAKRADESAGQIVEEEEFEQQDTAEGKSTKRMRSLVESEYEKESFDLLLGPFDNYAEMILQLGYATLFAATYPLAPAMACVANYLEIRVDLYSLGCLSTRPIPDGAQVHTNPHTHTRSQIHAQMNVQFASIHTPTFTAQFLVSHKNGNKGSHNQDHTPRSHAHTCMHVN